MTWIDAFVAWDEERQEEARRAEEAAIRSEGRRHGEGVGYTRGHAAGRVDGAKEIVRNIGEPLLRNELRHVARQMADAFMGAGAREIERLMREHFLSRQEAADLARRLAEEAEIEARVPSFEPGEGEVSIAACGSEVVQLSLRSYHRRVAIRITP